MPISEQQLLQIFPNAGRQAGVFVSPINAAAKRWQINTPKRLAAFLAQVGHESGQLRYVKEIWGPTPAQEGYDVRPDLGNTPERDGDGRRYMGRGLIQVTGRANYLKCSIALYGDDRLVKNPELLEEPEAATASAGWFWWVNSLNALADAGRFTDITRRINGGLNGQQDRLQIWQRARAVLAV
ncbi:glycoside hydrolase family 19 protein [Pseudomonas tohonis]|nr:pyocin R, lytic enzyme [Pseudomonas alcaligenes OT 69]MDN4144929.1 glycoside hydrolase family 19 protein [Pseudomonas tohonis]